jgi:hypothetical protein
MGQILIEYYKQISNQLGISGKMELAKATKIPSIQAAIEPDSEENILLFANAVELLINKDKIAPNK